jgi:hypothetical protein
MAASPPDRSDPADRARLRLARAERVQRTTRVAAALALYAIAAVGPFVARPVVGDSGAVFGAAIASLLLVGCGVALWPWTWSKREREQHTLAAVWAEARSDAGEPTPWARYAAWAEAKDDRVELVLLKRAGSAQHVAGVFARAVTRTVDAEAITDAAIAMEALREEAVRKEDGARKQYLDELAAAERKPLDDALRAVDEAAAAEQRRAEEQMLAELAAQEAADRQAQAAAIARSLRRP